MSDPKLCNDVLALLRTASSREDAMAILIRLTARFAALMALANGDSDSRAAFVHLRTLLQQETTHAFDRMKDDFRRLN